VFPSRINIVLAKHVESLLSKNPPGFFTRLGFAAFCRATKPALVSALANAPLSETGVADDGVPYVVCSDGTRLFGQPPSPIERRYYHALRKWIHPAISEETFRVAVDVVLRYQFPHALPAITVPYKRFQRRGFHKQHKDMITDIPGLSRSEREHLCRRFTPQFGESFLDIGAYMGYGTLRVRQFLGKEAPIIAIEAHPGNTSLLRRNIEANGATNISIVPRAVWKERTMLRMSTKGRQANTLLDGIVSDSDVHEVKVEADTVSNILEEHGMRELGLISITINGAEPEAVKSLKPFLANSRSPRLSLAGWYLRDGKRICELVEPILREAGLRTLVSPLGRVLAWKESK